MHDIYLYKHWLLEFFKLLNLSILYIHYRMVAAT